MPRGFGDSRVPMLYAALGYWGIGLPVAVLLGFWTDLEGRGIWVGLAGGLAVVATLMTVRWARRQRLGLTRRAAHPDASAMLAGEVPGVGPGVLS
jgi:MATE family multidrug resistance protein